MSIKYGILVTVIKRYKLLVLGWALVFFGALFACDWISFLSAYTYLAFPLAIFFSFLYLFIIWLLVKSKSSRLEKVLSHDCDPQAFVDIYSHIISEISKMNPLPDLSVQRLNLATGYLALGKYNMALDELNKCSSFRNNITGKRYDTIYHYCLLEVRIWSGELEKIEKQQAILKKCIESLPQNSFKRKYEMLYRFMNYRIGLAQDINEGAGNFFSEMYEKAKTPIERVFAKFYLGKAMLRSEHVLAREAFEYVITNGNKLYVAQEAKKILLTL